MRCLFVAPLKAPDHPVPSGDRTIARLFVRLLEGLGYTVVPAWGLSTFARDARSTDEMARLELAALNATEHILEREAVNQAGPPDFVFSYHVYYKAPDLVGPELARRFGIPYVLAEASLAPKRLAGPFHLGEILAQKAIAAANLILCPTARDREMLERARPPDQALVDLKPFIALEDWRATLALPRVENAVPRLLTVAMMRQGNKWMSYSMLAEALIQLTDVPWHLDIIGDGTMRSAVEEAFAPLGSRITFHGAMTDRKAQGAFYQAADLFVWPGVNEAFGMVFLEAQAHGVGCLAGHFGGIEDVIEHGRTGILIEQCDASRYAQNLRALLSDTQGRSELGVAARKFVFQDRNLAKAGDTLRSALASLGIAGARIETEARP
ncbi:RfaG Glycosyltransferase [Rhabdaerophilaceae bacterium]